MRDNKCPILGIVLLSVYLVILCIAFYLQNIVPKGMSGFSDILQLEDGVGIDILLALLMIACLATKRPKASVAACILYVFLFFSRFAMSDGNFGFLMQALVFTIMTTLAIISRQYMSNRYLWITVPVFCIVIIGLGLTPGLTAAKIFGSNEKGIMALVNADYVLYAALTLIAFWYTHSMSADKKNNKEIKVNKKPVVSKVEKPSQMELKDELRAITREREIDSYDIE